MTFYRFIIQFQICLFRTPALLTVSSELQNATGKYCFVCRCECYACSIDVSVSLEFATAPQLQNIPQTEDVSFSTFTITHNVHTTRRKISIHFVQLHDVAAWRRENLDEKNRYLQIRNWISCKYLSSCNVKQFDV